MASNKGSASRNPFEGESAPQENTDSRLRIVDDERKETRVYEITDNVKDYYERQLSKRLEAALAEWYDMWWEGNTLCVEYSAYVYNKQGSDVGIDDLINKHQFERGKKIALVNNISRVNIQDYADANPIYVEDMLIKAFSDEEGAEPIKVIDGTAATAAEMPFDFDDIEDKRNADGSVKKSGRGTNFSM